MIKIVNLFIVSFIALIFSGCSTGTLTFDPNKFLKKFSLSKSDSKLDESKESQLEESEEMEEKSATIRIIQINKEEEEKIIEKNIDDIKKQDIEILQNLAEKENINTNIYQIQDQLSILLDTSRVIFFDSGKYSLSEKSNLKEILSLVPNLKEKKIVLIGHTDSIGEDKYNQLLSELRAKEVYKIFLKNGLNKKQIDYIGYGEEQPISTNDTREGRTYNRRVEIMISENFESVNVFLNNRKVNQDFLNNHSEIEAGKVQISEKGLTKDKEIKDLKEFYSKINKPKREPFQINLKKRNHFISQ